MKIKAKNSNLVSTRLIVPIDGQIDIDSEGIADVSAKCAVVLVNNTSDWDYVNSKKKVVEEDDEDEEEEGVEDEDKSALKKMLSDMKLKDMQDMAQEAGYDEAEWSNITTKKLMSEYLLKKYDEAKSILEESGNENENSDNE